MINNYKQIAELFGYSFEKYSEQEVEDIQEYSKEVADALMKLALGYEDMEIEVTEAELSDRNGLLTGETRKTVKKKIKKFGPNFQALELYMNVEQGKIRTSHKAIDVQQIGSIDEKAFAGIDMSGIFDEVKHAEVDESTIGELEEAKDADSK